MLQGQIFLGIGLIITGLVFFLLVWWLLRIIPRQVNANTPPRTLIENQNGETPSHQDGILLVERGGWIRDINENARKLFELSPGEIPNIERLSRRVNPAEVFLEICAAEGKARFSINRKPVEAVSYRVPGALPTILVALRGLENYQALMTSGLESLPGTLSKSVSEFGESIGSSLSLDATAESILVNVERLVTPDFMEVKAWDEAAQILLPFRLEEKAGSVRSLQRGKASQFGEYANRLMANRSEIFIADMRISSGEIVDPTMQSLSQMGSYIGIPLQANGQLVGTLELGFVPVNGFGADDLQILQMVKGQAAVALHNAGLYEAQQRWNNQLLGLKNLAQAMSSSSDLNNLFARIVAGLSPLFNVEILGFLLYASQRRILEGQMPFQGLPDNIVEIYKTAVQPGSLIEKYLLGRETISTANASQDGTWEKLGLQDVALAASIHDTTLVPLISAGNSLGFLQLSNHRKGETSLSSEELHLSNIVSTQVAAIIDNALLMQQAQLGNRRVEALQKITNVVTSPATLDEMLKHALREAGDLFHVDTGSIFLLDEDAGVMRAHIPSVFGVPDDLIEPLSRITGNSAALKMTVAGSQHAFISGNLAKDRKVLPMYHPIIRKLNLVSGMVVPLIVNGKGIGEMMLGSLKESFFSNDDLQIAETIAGQLAVAITNTQREGETDQTLRRRSDYLTAMNRIVRELNSTSNLRELARIVYDECLAVTGASCGTVLLYEDEIPGAAERLVKFQLGHPQAEMLVEAGRQALKAGESRLLAGLNESGAPHAGVHSVLISPIFYQGETFGLVELHTAIIDGFDDSAIEMVRNIGIQAALAIGSALRIIEQQSSVELFRRRADTLMQLFETSKNLRVDETLVSAMGSIAEGIQKATTFNVVLLSLYDARTGLLTRVASAGLDEATFAKVQAHQQHWSSVAKLMKSEFEIGNLYFIPFDKAPIIPADVQILTTMTASEHKPNAWDPDDILLIPIYSNNQSPLGLISVDAPRDGLRPDRVALETLEVFASQAALTITSGLNIQNYKSQIETLNKEVGRQKNLVSFSMSSLPMLLHKDLEQTMGLNQLIQRARHIRASLQVTEALSRQTDLSSALLTLGQQVLTSFDMSVAIVARETNEGPQIVHVIGNLPSGVNPATSFGQRNPLRISLQTGEAIVSDNLDDDDIWHDASFLTNLQAKSFICIPVVINNKPVAAVLATDTEAMPALSTEDRQVYSQVSKQVSVILQNINLLTETRQRLQEVNLLLDFSRHLSGLNSREILKSLLENALKVVSPAQAGVVFVWEPHDELLMPLAASNYVDNESILGISYHQNEGLPGRVFAEKQPRRIDEVNFASDYNLPPENLLKYRKATGGRLPVSSLIVPIMTGEHQLGELVLDNFNTPAAFHLEDQAILHSLTQQVALSLENVRLMQTTEERSGQLQALNAVAATLTSSLQRDELVASLLDRMATIIPYDTAILWLRQENKMVVADAHGFDDNEERKGLSVEVVDSVLLSEMTRTGQAIVVDDVRSDPRFTSFVQPRYLAWMGIPLINKGQVTGVLAVEKTEAHFYSDELMQLSTTFASQAAVAIDNANLFEESKRRATDLDQRSQRLGMLNKFSAELGGSLSAEQVLSLTATQLISALQVDRAMLFLLDKNSRDYLLSVLPDEAGHASMYRGLPASAVLDHLRESQTVYVAEDTAHDPNLASLVDFLKDTHSLLILPLAGSEKLYAIVLQSQQSRRFLATEIELARTIGNQAAIALQNADLYQSTLATAERLAILNQVSYEIGSSLNTEDIYRAAHEATTRLMPAEAFVIALLDEETREVDGVYVVDAGQRISGVHMPYGQGLSGQVIATGQSILSLKASDAAAQGGLALGERGTPNSIVAVPMISGGKVIGSLSAQSYQFNAYAKDDQQLLSTLANQVTIAMLNARLFAETQKLAATLEQRVVERTAELEHEQHNTETLLRILTEVSASLDLDRALNRTLALLNDAIGAEQGTIMLLHAEDNRLHYRAGYGSALDAEESGAETDMSKLTLKIGEGLSGWVVRHRKPVLVGDLRQDSRWVATQGSQNHRSALVAPLLVGEDVIGTIMVFHHAIDYFGAEALEMVKAIGSQVAIAINNAQLYELIRDQAERLGSMLRQQQMEASRQTAILEAVADGVLVTDPSNHITFVNASVERILDIPEDQMQGQSLENFAGLFGKATRTWIYTVKEWSENPGSSQVGEMYAEQINLDNGRVALVHLAPVVWRNEFLGTVSIFRDITHEVEVDRLKSEFVATVSHELRTPMTSIRGYVDILLMGAAGAVSESQAHFLDIVKTNTERLNVLVNDLLDVSRMEAGRVMLSMHSVDLQEVASEVVAELQRRSSREKKPMEVTLEAEKSLPRVNADPERIRQILGNLMDNAYNYTPVEGKIKVILHKENGNVQVDIQDSGIGISLEQRERVFERFFRGEDPMVLATPGTGLGLSIVKQLVEMHHGKIWMDSMGIPGQGSTFSFTLPAPETEE
jgi:PAS domain S-box-containing protein